MDRLEAMALFVAAAEAGSLTGAARRLAQPLPSVSRKITELESHIGAKLLTRTTRSLALTEAGTEFLVASRRILEQVQEAERAASGEYRAPRGELVISAPIVFGRLHMTPVVAEFLATFAEIRVRLQLSDRNADLIEDRVDVALRIGALPDSGLTATRLGMLRRIVCGAPAYFDRNGEPATPEDLASRDCINFDGPPGGEFWGFGRDGRRMVRPTARLTVNTAEAALEAAVAGVGLTRVLPTRPPRRSRQAAFALLWPSSSRGTCRCSYSIKRVSRCPSSSDVFWTSPRRAFTAAPRGGSGRFLTMTVPGADRAGPCGPIVRTLVAPRGRRRPAIARRSADVADFAVAENGEFRADPASFQSLDRPNDGLA